MIENLNTEKASNWEDAPFDLHDGEVLPSMLKGSASNINKSVSIDTCDNDLTVHATWTFSLDTDHLDRLNEEGRADKVYGVISDDHEEGHEFAYGDYLYVLKGAEEKITKRLVNVIEKTVSNMSDVYINDAEMERWGEDCAFSITVSLTMDQDATLADVDTAVAPVFKVMNEMFDVNTADDVYVFGPMTIGE